MKIETIPHIARKGLIARLAIQCECPDSGITGSFLFSGESHRNKHSRVTPVFDDLAELFPAVREHWQEIREGNASLGFIRK